MNRIRYDADQYISNLYIGDSYSWFKLTEYTTDDLKLLQGQRIFEDLSINRLRSFYH